MGLLRPGGAGHRLHGTADPISDPINGNEVTQQWITTNQLAARRTSPPPSSIPAAPSTTLPGRAEKASSRLRGAWQDVHGRDMFVYYKVDGMGHAWSGGTPGSIFTDPRGPGASEIMYEFFMTHPKEKGK